MNIRTPVTQAAAALVLALAAQTAHALQYTGGPTYFQAPVTQLGSVNSGTSLLTLGTSNADIDVTGQFAVNLNAGPSNGTLVRWVVDRPLAANQLFTNAVTTTLLDGFSLPPAGTVGNTAGAVRTFITDLSQPNSVIGSSMSSIAISLNAGSATWSTLTATSSSFTLLTGGNYALRQVFDLDGVYFSGPGGTWLVDVPVLSGIAAVPEPATAALLLLGGAGLLLDVARRKGQP